MDEFKIEKNVPIPPRKKRGLSKTGMTATLRTMKVGESVLFTTAISSACTLYRSVDGKFTARIVKGGVRVWRTK